jgi:hypothetical protein
MNQSRLKQIIKEEIRKVLNEAHLDYSDLKQYIVKDNLYGGLFGTIELVIPDEVLGEMAKNHPGPGVLNKEIVGAIEKDRGRGIGITIILNGDVIKPGIDLSELD